VRPSLSLSLLLHDLWDAVLTPTPARPLARSYVSRANPRDASRHTILGTQWYKPREFLAQMNVNLANGWGIVRTIVDLCFKQPEGKFVLMRDPMNVRPLSLSLFLPLSLGSPRAGWC